MMRFISLSCLVAGAAAAQIQSVSFQQAFSVGNLGGGQLEIAANLTKAQLSFVEEAAFTALTHPNFPSYQVRVKKTNFCDPTVK